MAAAAAASSGAAGGGDASPLPAAGRRAREGRGGEGAAGAGPGRMRGALRFAPHVVRGGGGAGPRARWVFPGGLSTPIYLKKFFLKSENRFYVY